MTIESKKIVGCEEWFRLPKLNVFAIKARIDSGAKTSAIHAYNIQTFKRDGVLWVNFKLLPIQNNRKVVIRCEAKVIDRRVVKSSAGTSERRYVISTFVEYKGKAWEIELTLANRDSMGYRMLLGREAMQGRMLVDPSFSFIGGDLKEKEITKKYTKHTTLSSGLKIGLLGSNPDLYSNRRIIEAGRERGHNIKFYSIKQCYMKLDAATPEVHYRGGLILNDLDAIIPRIRPSITFYGCALVRHFESIGIYTLNSSEAIRCSRDKLFSLQLLLKSGMDIPTTGFANSPIDTNNLIGMIGDPPFIIKLLEGAQGKGVVLAETKKAAESVINAFKTLHADLLVQEFIKEADGKDLRLFVVNSKVVAAMQREAKSGEFRANLHQGGSKSAVKVTAEEKRIAVRAAKTLGLQVAGVDIIRSKKGPLLLEVNSSPGLEGIEEVTGRDVASQMIQAIEKKLNWTREPAAATHPLEIAKIAEPFDL